MLTFLLFCFSYLLQAASDDVGLNADEESASKKEKNKEEVKEKMEVVKLHSFCSWTTFFLSWHKHLFILLQEYFSVWPLQ